VWELPPVAEAVAGRDADALIRLVKEYTGLSQHALARMTGLSQTTVFAILNHKAGLKNIDRINTALDGLGALLRRTESEPSPVEGERPPASTAPSLSSKPEGKPPTSQALWQQIAAGSESEAVRILRMADRQLAGGSLYTIVMRYLSSRVGPVLLSEEGGSSVFIAAAGLTEMAGWMAHDSGRDDIAARHFQRALNLARAGDTDDLIAQIWASRAHLALHRADTGSALAAAEQAWRHLNGAEDSALRGRVLAMLTRAHAAQGDAIAARASLGQAEHLLSVPTVAPRSEWTSPFDLGSLASEAARSLLDLGDHTAAAEHAHHVLRLRSRERVRARALASLILARALIAGGQVEEAASLAGEVAGSTAAVGSFVAGSHLRAVAEELNPYRRLPEVATVLRNVDGSLARAERGRLAMEGERHGR
jgi:tetratricopeptide (TPR) repeat protein/DNA-binding XRE family transcriptional regulator